MSDNPIKTLWDNDQAMREIESLRQQLSAMTLDRDEWKEAHDVVVANCKLSDEQHHKDMEGYAAALAIQPDDSALKAWLGEPVAYLFDGYEALALEEVESDSFKESPELYIPLYSPKGMTK